jgi:hypothetical protein
MHSDQAPYRALYDAYYDYEGPDFYDDLVRPWLRQQDGERRWLEDFGRRRGKPIPDATIEDLWRLYAFSRIVDLLLRHARFAEFMESFGLQRIERKAFHPFFHEIVSVGEVREYWPGYMLGNLTIIRAGCGIAPRPEITKHIAETSTLYWTWNREHRPTDDLSAGWGGNSQWRTAFRRDYAIDGRLHYNVDRLKKPDEDDLEPSERLEMLRHRCFVHCTKPDDDLWPYDYTHQEDL